MNHSRNCSTVKPIIINQEGLHRAGLNLLSQLFLGGVLSYIKIVIHLQSQPELWRHLKIPCQSQCCVSGNGTFSMDNLVDTTRRNMNIFGQSVLADFFRLQKLFHEDFSRVKREHFLFTHGHLLMVIDDFNVISVFFLPYETNTPLIIYSDAVLTFPLPLQAFKVIRGWVSKVTHIFSPVQHAEFSKSYALDGLRQFARKLTVENLFSFSRFKGLYHMPILTQSVNNGKRYLDAFQPFLSKEQLN